MTKQKYCEELDATSQRMIVEITSQMQVWLALCQAGQHVQGLHTAGQISVAGLLNTIDL
jgi:hypothetical protein